MFGTIIVSLMIIAGIAGFVLIPPYLKDDPDSRYKAHHNRSIDRLVVRAVSGFLAFLGLIFMAMLCVDTVKDGHVGVTLAFGEFGSETLGTGLQPHLPWESVISIDTRVQSFTFSDDEQEAISGPISAQADGGGNLNIEHTIQLQVDKATADDLLREVGSDWFNTVVLPPIRSCTRDATIDLTLEEAYTTRRAEIGTNTFDCVSAKVNPYGVTLVDVLIRDVDPGKAVREAIDAKQKAEQDLQRAAIQTRVISEEARQESIRSFGVSNAEQIVACGGVETKNEEGEVEIVPNESCEEQFSIEYLQWLYINQLDKIKGAVILPPNFDGELFVQTPSQSNG